MNQNEFINKFLNDPESFYNSIESLSSKEIESMMNFEEMLVELKFSGLQAHDENRISILVDQLRAGKKNDADVSDLSSALEILSAYKKMEQGSKRPVPDALMAVIERTLGHKKHPAPSLVVKLVEDGIRVIKSTMQGVTFIPQPVPSMRSAAVVQKNTAPLTFRQEFSGNTIEYSILKESSDDMMLTMNFPDKMGRYNVQLKSGSRIVDAVKLSEQEKSVTFRKLDAGYYDIEISGTLNHTFCIFIEKE